MELKCFEDVRNHMRGFEDHPVKWFFENCLNGLVYEYETKLGTLKRLFDRDDISHFEFVGFQLDAEDCAKTKCLRLIDKIKEFRKAMAL
jgi:hypothetical protein